MKILHLLGELRPSGAEVMVALATPLWKSLGCEVHVISLSDKPGEYTETMEQAGCTIHFQHTEAGRIMSSIPLWKMLRAIKPDVLHIHSEKRNLMNTITSSLCGIPVVRTIHNNFLFTGRLRWQKTFERYICRVLGSRHVAISKSVSTNEIMRFFNPTVLSWNWFDASSFSIPSLLEKSESRKKLGVPDEAKILVSVGNGSTVKNYAAIIESMGILNDPDLMYFQVGNPNTSGEDANLVQRLNLTDRVIFVGPRHDIKDWLRAADLYVMPSLFEGFGLAAAEALASGCNCLFTNCPGLTDFKDFGIKAFWSETGALSIVNAIKQWQSAPISPDILAENASIICEEFSVERRASDYFLLWKRAYDM